MNTDATIRLSLSFCDTTFLEGLDIKYSIVSMKLIDSNNAAFYKSLKFAFFRDSLFCFDASLIEMKHEFWCMVHKHGSTSSIFFSQNFSAVATDNTRFSRLVMIARCLGSRLQINSFNWIASSFLWCWSETLFRLHEKRTKWCRSGYYFCWKQPSTGKSLIFYILIWANLRCNRAIGFEH